MPGGSCGARTPGRSVKTGTYNIVAATPTLSPLPGTYNTPQSVTISDATPGVSIYYTLNGSTPTTSSTLYTGVAIPVSTTTTINAIAVGNGYAASLVKTGTYSIVAATPILSSWPITWRSSLNSPTRVEPAGS